MKLLLFHTLFLSLCICSVHSSVSYRTNREATSVQNPTPVCKSYLWYNIRFPSERESTMPYFIHNNETLKNATYALDEHAFFNCKLTNCTLVYSGGSFEFVNMQLENCQWKFRNDANLTIQVLMSIGMLKQGQAPPQNFQGSAGQQVH